MLLLLALGLLGVVVSSSVEVKKKGEDEKDEIDADTSAGNANHRSPVAQHGGWINGF